MPIYWNSGHLSKPLVGSLNLVGVDLKTDVGATQSLCRYASRARPAERIEYDYISPHIAICFDAAQWKRLRKSRVMLQAVNLLVGKLPDRPDRRRCTKGMLLMTSEQVDGFMLAMGTTTSALGHRIAFLPDDLAT